jgi:hypothetical protein
VIEDRGRRGTGGVLDSMTRAALFVLVIVARGAVEAWSPQGHRLVALVAAGHLTPTARENVRAGGRGDNWRDCAVDRIFYSQQRLANRSLDRADRAVALKFLVHLVGDLHQPFHAIGLARGGNDTPVSLFGTTVCAYDDGTPYACNMHATWDTALIAHRSLNDEQYRAALERIINDRGWQTAAAGGGRRIGPSSRTGWPHRRSCRREA